MQDIVAKIDRAKEILSPGRGPTDAEGAELIWLGIDAIGELLANSRRIAVALEQINLNTHPSA